MSSQSRLAVLLDGGGHGYAEVGSKAAALDRLIAAGFRVPLAVGVTTAAYHDFVAKAGLQDLIAEMAERPVPPPALGDDWRREIDAAFLAAPMPPQLEEALCWAHATVGEGCRLAVRSSAAAEDLDDASFAGQYLSVIDVEGFDEVVEAVRRVWASLWHPWASAYRRRMGVTETDLTMGVIVQRLVPAEHSGVVFTRDPNAPRLLRLEVVEGLGEQLVSGNVTPDVYQLRRPGLRRVDDGELDPNLRAAAHVALRIEQHFDSVPQDVEWSVAADGVWVLQARPITTISAGSEHDDGFDTRVDAGDRHVAAGVTEMLPGVLSPLLWTINGPMVEEAFRSLYHSLGALPEHVDGPFAFIARRRGRARLNLSLMQEVGGRMGGWSPVEVERLYLGSARGPSPPAPARRRRRLLDFRGLRARRSAPVAAEAFRVAVHAALEARPRPEALLDHELVAYRWRVRDLASAGMRAELAVAAVGVAAYRSLESLLGRWVGDQAEMWAQQLTRDAGRGAETPVSSALQRLVDLDAGARVELEQALAATGPAAEWSAGGLPPAAQQLVAGLLSDLVRLGSAAIYAGRTWDEQDGAIAATLRAAVRAGAEDGAAVTGLDDLEKMLTSAARWRFVRIVTGQIVDMRLRVLRKMVAEATMLLDRREQAKAALLMLGGEERRIIIEVGRRLERRGLIDAAADVELLADWELEDLLLERRGPNAIELQRRRQILHRWRAEPVRAPAVGAPWMAQDRALSGWGASPGRYRGPAAVVLDAAAAGPLPPGAVIVAPATDPSWVPLLLQAGGLVVERGGPLSHAAIVAREFGLPAVLNVEMATTLVPDGAEIDVDGTAGTVTLVGLGPSVDSSGQEAHVDLS